MKSFSSFFKKMLISGIRIKIPFLLIEKSMLNLISLFLIIHLSNESIFCHFYLFFFFFSYFLMLYSGEDFIGVKINVLTKSLICFTFLILQSVTQRLDLKLEEDSIFYKLGSYGLISFSDYIFLLTVLSSKFYLQL